MIGTRKTSQRVCSPAFHISARSKRGGSPFYGVLHRLKTLKVSVHAEKFGYVGRRRRKEFDYRLTSRIRQENERDRLAIRY